MRCPLDESTLVISSRDGIEIDYCPQCRGVWLDRGELDKIIERSLSSPSGQPDRARSEQPPRYEERPRYEDRPYDLRPPHHDRERYDDRYRKRKRRSFLEDIFDFD